MAKPHHIIVPKLFTNQGFRKRDRKDFTLPMLLIKYLKVSKSIFLVTYNHHIFNIFK